MLRLLTRLRNRFRYRRFADDLEEELVLHRALSEQAFRQSGLREEEVRAAALRALGNETRMREIGSFAAGYAVRGYLYGVSPVDPMALGAVLVLLGLAALAATLVPLRRAVRTDPTVALRSE